MNYSIKAEINQCGTKRSEVSLRDMMHLLRKYDVAPVGCNDAMFAKNISEATSLGEAVIISVSVIICRKAKIKVRRRPAGGGNSPPDCCD